MLSTDRAYVEREWRGHCDPAGPADPARPPLPAADVDLAPFLRDIIPGERGQPWTGRSPDLADHFRRIEPEFRESPRIAHLTACAIVCLRRNSHQPEALTLFRRILAEAGPEVAKTLSSRWLASVCDTVVDTSDSDLDRAVALTGTIFISTVKIAETELRLYRPQRPWPPATRLRHGGEIYDGVQTLWTVGRGDVDNMFLRIERGLRIASPVTPVVEQMIHRALESDTFLNRIIGTTGRARLPIAPKDKLEALKRILRTL